MKINREIKLKDYTYLYFYKVINQIKSYVTQAERSTVFSSVVLTLKRDHRDSVHYF